MFDLIIKNGLVYDGKGSEPFKADLAISNEKIVEIGSFHKLFGGNTLLQILGKQKEVEANLTKYKNEIEGNIIDASASVAVQIINKIIPKRISTEDLKPLFKNFNQSNKG